MLSEFHLGATYDAILRRRLWHHRQFDVLLIPLVILVLTYAFSLGGQTILLTSIAMYAAVWHRGRQSLGVARFYQRGMGGPVSRTHEVLFRGAIYLPMLAAVLAYTQLAPEEYEGEPYIALSVGAEITWTVGLGAVLWVIAYFAWTLRQSRADRVTFTPGKTEIRIHPGEWWVVLAHGVAFGSGYVLGASNVSFLLVLAVHHEVQYLYFTYAMARRPGNFPEVAKTAHGLATIELNSIASDNSGSSAANRGEIRGFFSTVACDRFRRSRCRRLVRTRMAGAARHGRTFLSLLARWTHLDETVVSKLN